MSNPLIPSATVSFTTSLECYPNANTANSKRSGSTTSSRNCWTVPTLPATRFSKTSAGGFAIALLRSATLSIRPLETSLIRHRPARPLRLQSPAESTAISVNPHRRLKQPVKPNHPLLTALPYRRSILTPLTSQDLHTQYRTLTQDNGTSKFSLFINVLESS